MIKTKRFKLDSIFSQIHIGDFHASSDLNEGKIPLVSCKTEKSPERGIEGYYAIPRNKTYKNVVTITCDGIYATTAFFHPYKIAAKDNVLVCIPKKGIKISTILYAVACINMERWRFSYGRKCYLNKLDTLSVPFPVDKENEIDQDKIEKILSSIHFKGISKKAIKSLQKTSI